MKKVNSHIIRTINRAMICGLLVGAIIVHPYLSTDLACAADDPYGTSTLAPPLATKPPCEIVKNENGELEIVTNDDAINFWDQETVQNVNSGNILGRSFRNRWAFVDVSIIIAQALRLQISKHSLIPLIKKHIENRDGQAEIHLAGFELSKIETISNGDKITAVLLPFQIKSGKWREYKYYLASNADEEADMNILLDNKTYLCVKILDSSFDRLNSIHPQPKIIDTGSLDPSNPPLINLWKDESPFDIAEDLAKMKKDLEQNGLENFRPVEDQEILLEMRIAKEKHIDQAKGDPGYACDVYEYMNSPHKLQIIQKSIGNVDTVRDFFAGEKPWCCPTFFINGDNSHLYELNLVSLGYYPLSQVNALGAMGEYWKNVPIQLRDIISKAVSESFLGGDEFFSHGHLHQDNILLKFDDNGRLIDVKIIDWKLVGKTRLKNYPPLEDFFDGKIDNLLGANLSHLKLEGVNIAGANLREAVLDIVVMTWADLEGVNLTDATIKGFFDFSNMQRAILRRANLTTSFFRAVDFRYAVLTDADFAKSILYDADFRNAVIDNANFENAELERTKFDLKWASKFKEMGCKVEIKDGWCEVTSSKPLNRFKPPNVNPESEKIHSKTFSDVIRLAEASNEDQPIIIAIGNSWIKGYERGRYLQYDALNPLIISIRKFCEERGIILLETEDENLLSAIGSEKTKDGKRNAKVIVLAGSDTVTSDNFEPLRNDENTFLAGVDNSNLTTDSYIRIMEMLTLTLKLAFGQDIERYDGEAKTFVPEIQIERDKKFPNVYIFIPRAAPMEFEDLRAVYEMQTFA